MDTQPVSEWHAEGTAPLRAPKFRVITRPMTSTGTSRRRILTPARNGRGDPEPQDSSDAGPSSVFSQATEEDSNVIGSGPDLCVGGHGAPVLGAARLEGELENLER